VNDADPVEPPEEPLEIRLERAVWEATERLTENQHGRPFTIDHTSVRGYVVVARLRPGEQILVDAYPYEEFVDRAPNLGT